MKRTIAVAVLALHASLAQAAFKCVDEKGITHFGDTPPAACANVLMLEVTPTGTVLRRIEPTPTAEKLGLMQEENERARTAEKAASEQRRKDLALLSTYSSEREFDVARDRNLEPIRGRIRNNEERLKAIDAREQKIAEEMEFYKAGKSRSAGAKKEPSGPPPMLVQEQERLASEKKTVTASIAREEDEMKALHTRFEGDKKRWVELKSGVIAKPSEEKIAKTVTLSAGAAGRAKCGEKIYECPAGEQYICYEQDVFGRRRAYKVACVVERK